MQNSKLLIKTLPEPNRPDDLPKSAQWLAGEGAGSWFFIEITSKENEFLIKRFSPKGKLECRGIFQMESTMCNLDLQKTFKFVHLSHCAFVHIEQSKVVFKLIRKVNSGSA
jgi:hypothetical protein